MNLDSRRCHPPFHGTASTATMFTQASFDTCFDDTALPCSITAAATVLFAVGMLILAALYIRADFLDFIALGPGGTPSTFNGFLRVKFLGLFALKNRYVSNLTPSDSKWDGLVNLPRRNRPRPVTKGIAPHRQMDQWPDDETYIKLAVGIEQMAYGNKQDLAIGTSCFEKHGTGLFSKSPVAKTCRGEIVHLHGSDGSMHLTLHPNDVKTVLDAGWGERHPLAGVFNKRWIFPHLPAGFIMLYAPQNDQEVDIVLRIISAATAFVNGRESEACRGFEDDHIEKQHLGLDRGCDVAFHAPSIVVTECSP